MPEKPGGTGARESMESEKIGKNGEREYDRYLFPRDVFALSVGVMVGWGAFVMPGTTFLPWRGH